MSCSRSLRASFGALAVLVAIAAPAVAVDDASLATSAKATDWIVTQQQADGGFEVAGFPGFETPDAVLALAEQAQSGPTWDTGAALARVQSVANAGAKSPLDALDDLADGAFGVVKAGQAAKLVVLVTAPLGLDAAAFDPQGDGAANLVALMDAGALAGGSYGAGALNATLYAALAQQLIGRTVPADTLAFIRNAQQANGAWDFSGDPSGTSDDLDTTALAVQALIASGTGPSDPAISKALTFLAAKQNADGSWSAFGAPDPNATSTAMLALVAAGIDASNPCWRDIRVPAKLGTTYASPAGSLRAKQAADGHVASPNDAFGVTTFATAQTVQALLGRWLPIDRAAQQPCTQPTVTTPPPTTGAPTTMSTTSPSTTAPVVTSSTVVVAGAQAAAAPTPTRVTGELSRTGAAAADTLLLLGAACCSIGLALAVGARRRAPTT